MAIPSSRKLISPITTTNGAASPTKRPQPIPWTHQETVNLIGAYQQKWYTLKRGPLRSSQWEEVAVVIAARCGYDFNHPSKSAVQCRHKMEKLRQRHRVEKHRLVNGTPPRAWQYFGLMDDLERGPLPISAQPLVALAPNKDDDEEREAVNEIELVSGLTAEIKAFAERFNALENLKMKMMKETERCRLQMENKRLEMILQSQRRIVDSIRRAFRSSKRMKMSQEI